MLKPLGDRIVVKQQAEKEESIGAFVIAGASQDKTILATVVAVGQGSRTLTGELVAPSVATGQTVLIDRHAGVEVKDNDEKVLIVREADILAIVE